MQTRQNDITSQCYSVVRLVTHKRSHFRTQTKQN